MNVDEVLDHELIAVDASGEMCACGTRAATILEHLGAVAVAALGGQLSRAQLDAADLERTRQVIAERAAEQDALREQADALGLTGFIERTEWLIEHRSSLDALAWQLRWAGLPTDEATPTRSKPGPRGPRFRPTPRQLEIALAVLDKQTATAESQKAAA